MITDFRNHSNVSRGIKNNNPGNIKNNRTQWQGRVSEKENFDKIFVVFEDMTFGLRALMMNLLSYRKRHNLHTIEELISRWAPPFENQTQKYIAFVENQTGIGKNTPLSFDRKELISIAKAIVIYENGHQNAAQIHPSLYDKAFEMIGQIRLPELKKKL